MDHCTDALVSNFAWSFLHELKTYLFISFLKNCVHIVGTSFYSLRIEPFAFLFVYYRNMRGFPLGPQRRKGDTQKVGQKYGRHSCRKDQSKVVVKHGRHVDAEVASSRTIILGRCPAAGFSKYQRSGSKELRTWSILRVITRNRLISFVQLMNEVRVHTRLLAIFGLKFGGQYSAFQSEHRI